MRTLFCFLFCCSASAAPIVLDYGAHEFRSGTSIAIPHTVAMLISTSDYLNWLGGPFHVQDEWTLSGLTAANAGEVFTLNEANAASQGVDWSILETATLQLGAPGWVDTPWVLGFRSDIFSNPTGALYLPAPVPFGSGLHPVITNLDRVDLTIEELFSSPIGSVVRIHPVVYGEGSYVAIPEPAAWLMLCVGLLHVGIRRRKTTR